MNSSRPASCKNYTVSYSGGNEKSHYYVSGGFLDQSGTDPLGELPAIHLPEQQRHAGIFRWLKLSNNITFSTDKEIGRLLLDQRRHEGPAHPVGQGCRRFVERSRGNSYWYGDIRNPIGTLYTNDNQTKGYNFLANISAEVTLFPWLRFKSTFGYDAKMWYNDNFSQAYDYSPPRPSRETTRYQDTNKSFTYLWDNFYFTFEHTFADKHDVNLMVGSPHSGTAPMPSTPRWPASSSTASTNSTTEPR